MATLGGGLVRNETEARIEGSGVECLLNGVYIATRPRARRQPDPRPPRRARAATRDQFYKGVVDGQRARGVRRQDHRPQGRAEDQRLPEERQPAAVGRRRDRHQARARDLRRRREVQPRRHLRASSTRRRCSICARAASTAATAESVLTFAFAAEVIERFADPTVRQHVRARGRWRGCRAAPRWRSWRERAGRSGARGAAAYDVARVRARLPDPRARRMNGRPLVYLDTAASAQKPRGGDRHAEALLRAGLRQHPSRRVRPQPARDRRCTTRRARKVQRFINAADWREIVFTRNATEAINLVAASFLAAAAAARRRDPGHRDGAPRQHRALAAARPRRPVPRWWRRRSTTRASCCSTRSSSGSPSAPG